MKNLIVLLALNTMIIATGFSSDKLKEVKAKVGNIELLKNWAVGEVREANGISIIRSSGENTPYARTNIAYTSFNQIKGVLEAKASTSTDGTSDGSFENCRGGQITLFFDRDMESLADANLFTLSVMNSTQTEVLYQKQLLKEAPHYYVQGIWYNCKTINVPSNLGKDFVVMIEDAGLKQAYTFRVSNNEIQYIQPVQTNPVISSK